jgi:hypothetical protein
MILEFEIARYERLRRVVNVLIDFASYRLAPSNLHTSLTGKLPGEEEPMEQA